LLVEKDKSKNEWKLIHNVDELLECATPATFGINNEKVYDEEYRKAKAIENFHTTFDTSVVYNQIKKTLFPHQDIIIEKYRVNMYEKDGHFKAHKDTPRSKTFAASLVVCLPYEFSGGDFSIKHKEQTFKIDWASLSKTHHQWIAFYGDCVHWIDPVVSGVRVTIAYNIFLNNIDKKEDVFFKNELLNMKLDKLFSKKEISINETKLYAISTSHQYTHATDTVLKGSDALLFKKLEEAKLNPRVGTVVYEDLDNEDELYVVEKVLDYVPVYHLHDIDLLESLGYSHDVILEEKITWLKPSSKEKASEQSVSAYGNEPSIAYVYSNYVILFGLTTDDEGIFFL
jgi:hypothetical protein